MKRCSNHIHDEIVVLAPPLARGCVADFSDLPKRTLSAVVICCLGLAAIVLGGVVFSLFACAWSLAMTFELIALSSPNYPFKNRIVLAIAMSAACAISIFWIVNSAFELPFMAVFTLLCAMALPNGRLKFYVFGIGIVLAASAFAELRQFNGAVSAIWFISVVAASDIAGYFFGKIFGGPLIVPEISPGKRWTGAAAGLVAAAAVGFGFSGSLGTWVSWASPLLAVTAQAGDIAESWLKRKAGVKDSSSAIPGHGGFLDRFDSYVGAGSLLWLIGALGLVPTEPPL